LTTYEHAVDFLTSEYAHTVACRNTKVPIQPKSRIQMDVGLAVENIKPGPSLAKRAENLYTCGPSRRQMLMQPNPRATGFWRCWTNTI
jgi:hypothetical protein